MKDKNWNRYLLEFLSIFIAVLSAFALNNWNDNRRNQIAEAKILLEIQNGLEKDYKDVDSNLSGHKNGIKACKFWRRIINNETPNLDTLPQYYLGLTRDFTSIQNTSGYETLKSRGFELIANDSLRSKIISLYEFDYQTLRKLEEEYYESQFQKNYFIEINNSIASNFKFDSRGNINGIDIPLNLSNARKNMLLSYLWKIQVNRNFVIQYYEEVKLKIDNLKKEIERELVQ